MATPANVLTGAKETLQKAKNFTKSIDRQAGHPYPASQYKAAYKARKTPSSASDTSTPKFAEGTTTDKDLGAIQKNVSDYEKAYGPVGK